MGPGGSRFDPGVPDSVNNYGVSPLTVAVAALVLQTQTNEITRHELPKRSKTSIDGRNVPFFSLDHRIETQAAGRFGGSPVQRIRLVFLLGSARNSISREQEDVAARVATSRR